MGRRSNIYNSEDDRPGECVYQNFVKKESEHSVDKSAGSRCHTLSAVCVSFLCGLLFICIIVLSVKLNTMSEEREQILIRYHNVTTERGHLQSERDQLQTERDSLNNSIQRCLRYFETSGKKSWNDSRQECREKGADLVIINNKEEQEYLSRRFPVEAWIGLIDTAEEGKWMWVDGTPLSTNFWLEGEPNDFGNKEDCAVTGTKFAEKSTVNTWADYPCALGVSGICQKNTNK